MFKVNIKRKYIKITKDKEIIILPLWNIFSNSRLKLEGFLHIDLVDDIIFYVKKDNNSFQNCSWGVFDF
jgi:hypothetical protein